MPKVPVTIEGHVDARESGTMLAFKSHPASGAMLICMAYTATWDNGDIQIQLLLKDKSGSCGPTTASVYVANKGYMEGQGQSCNLWPCWFPEAMITTRANLI